MILTIIHSIDSLKLIFIPFSNNKNKKQTYAFLDIYCNFVVVLCCMKICLFKSLEEAEMWAEQRLSMRNAKWVKLLERWYNKIRWLVIFYKYIRTRRGLWWEGRKETKSK